MSTRINLILLIVLLSSCFSNSDLSYIDPNYLESTEFNEASVDYTNDSLYNQEDSTLQDLSSTENEYDYSYSSRIRRFHRPMYYDNYYGGFHTNYYGYHYDPFYYSTNFYYGYNWHSPYFYGNYYSPYFYSNYYSPFYGNYYSSYGYGNNYYNTGYVIYNSNRSITTGHRGSLSTKGVRGVKLNNTINFSTKYNSSNKKNKSNTNYKNSNKKNNSNTNYKNSNNRSNYKNSNNRSNYKNSNNRNTKKPRN